jgi:hypothetical protein
MDDPAKDDRLIQEIRSLRQDIGRWVSRMLWVFAGSVVLVCLTFGPSLSGDAKEALGAGFALLGLLYLVGLVCQAFFNFRLRRRHERESFALLSGRVPGARRRAD